MSACEAGTVERVVGIAGNESISDVRGVEITPGCDPGAEWGSAGTSGASVRRDPANLHGKGRVGGSSDLESLRLCLWETAGRDPAVMDRERSTARAAPEGVRAGKESADECRDPGSSRGEGAGQGFAPKGRHQAGATLAVSDPVLGDSWTVNRPGYLEADSVDHGGSSTSGHDMDSISHTDIDSGWTEQAAVWNKGATAVVSQTRPIEAEWPFVLLGFHADNGGEFLNHPLWRSFTARQKPVPLTRSREYRKNDNAPVEQKNWTKVRQLLGNARYDQPERVDLVQDLYRNEWRWRQNFFQPVMKRVEKHREGPKVHKRYDRAQTPAQRLLAWKGLAKDKRQWLLRMQASLDPMELTQRLHGK